MHRNHVRFHVGFPCETLFANGTFKLGRRATLVHHVPAQQFFPIDPFIGMTASVRTDRRVRRRTPVQQTDNRFSCSEHTILIQTIIRIPCVYIGIL